MRRYVMIVDGQEISFRNLRDAASWLDLSPENRDDMELAMKKRGWWEPLRQDVPAIRLEDRDWEPSDEQMNSIAPDRDEWKHQAAEWQKLKR